MTAEAQTIQDLAPRPKALSSYKRDLNTTMMASGGDLMVTSQGPHQR